MQCIRSTAWHSNITSTMYVCGDIKYWITRCRNEYIYFMMTFIVCIYIRQSVQLLTVNTISKIKCYINVYTLVLLLLIGIQLLEFARVLGPGQIVTLLND
jgi:hypothetical protein